MAKDGFELEGVVTENLRGSQFKVKLIDNGLDVICTLSGKLRINNIRILEGDKVTVEISSSDVTRGRITWRHK